MRLFVPMIALSLTACGGGGKPAPVTCNGSEANCSRRYDQVTIAATHNSYAYASGGPVTYQEPNQDLPIPEQLAYGIRGFGIRPCPPFGPDAQPGVLYVTHNYASLGGALGGEPLLNILTEFKTFLDAHPNEVITLLEEDTSVTSAQVAEVFRQAGLDRLAYVHDKAKGWPTLAEMAKSGKRRLVLFTDAHDARESWQLPMWDYITDTDYNITDESQFSCDVYRGDQSNDLYFINQFIYADFGGGIVVADEAKAKAANAPDAVYDRAVKCWTQLHKVPIFIYVDWFGQGNVKEAVDRLNALPR